MEAIILTLQLNNKAVQKKEKETQETIDKPILQLKKLRKKVKEGNEKKKRGTKEGAQETGESVLVTKTRTYIDEERYEKINKRVTVVSPIETVKPDLSCSKKSYWRSAQESESYEFMDYEKETGEWFLREVQRLRDWEERLRVAERAVDYKSEMLLIKRYMDNESRMKEFIAMKREYISTWTQYVKEKKDEMLQLEREMAIRSEHYEWNKETEDSKEKMPSVSELGDEVSQESKDGSLIQSDSIEFSSTQDQILQPEKDGCEGNMLKRRFDKAGENIILKGKHYQVLMHNSRAGNNVASDKSPHGANGSNNSQGPPPSLQNWPDQTRLQQKFSSISCSKLPHLNQQGGSQRSLKSIVQMTPSQQQAQFFSNTPKNVSRLRKDPLTSSAAAVPSFSRAHTPMCSSSTTVRHCNPPRISHLSHNVNSVSTANLQLEDSHSSSSPRPPSCSFSYSFSSIPSHTERVLAVAKHDFNGLDRGDLAFKRDEVLVILQQQGNWWTAARQDYSQVGKVPKNYLIVLTPHYHQHQHQLVANQMQQQQQQKRSPYRQYLPASRHTMRPMVSGCEA